MKKVYLSIVLLSCIHSVSCQTDTPKVYSSDIDNFWIAYDSIRNTKDSSRQIYFINSLYIDKGTEGLKAFMAARDYTAELWVRLINKYPRFWNSVRPNTLALRSKQTEIDASIKRLKKIYPALKEAKIYFTIGGLRSGGTTAPGMVLIGSEIAAGNSTTDVSEFPDTWLAGVFKEQNMDHTVDLNIHEYIHTQQQSEGKNLLAWAITEGSCDFITELVAGKQLQTDYIKYGLQHEAELKEQFKQEMFMAYYINWMYSGVRVRKVADLGYFIGYRICKSYYEQAGNKQKAVQDIIELNYADSSAVETFLVKSNYYGKQIDKAGLIKNFQALQPAVVKIDPAIDGDSLVDPSVKEIRVYFSKPMKEGQSFIPGTKGKEHNPVAGINGWSADKQSVLVKINLKSKQDYEFIISDDRFISADGYPLINHTVKFSTK